MKLKLLCILLTVLFLVSCTNDFWPNGHTNAYSTNTLSRNDTASLHVFFISDWGFSGSADQRSVASEMSKMSKLLRLDFIMTCGDNFQIAGVDSVNDPLWKVNYEQVYADSALQVPWYPALGNHDHYGNVNAQVQYSQINKNWNMPATYYSFAKKVQENCNVKFIVLDTYQLELDYFNLADSNAYDSISQYKWLKHELLNTNSNWIIVTGHYPMYSAGSVHGDTYVLNKIVKPLFEKYNVDFYICGHDHDFEHAKVKGEYTDYIVTGTSGSIRPTGSNNRTVFSLSSLGFTFLSINKNNIKLYFINTEGNVTYSFTKNKYQSGRRNPDLQ